MSILEAIRVVSHSVVATEGVAEVEAAFDEWVASATLKHKQAIHSVRPHIRPVFTEYVSTAAFVTRTSRAIEEMSECVTRMYPLFISDEAVDARTVHSRCGTLRALVSAFTKMVYDTIAETSWGDLTCATPEPWGLAVTSYLFTFMGEVQTESSAFHRRWMAEYRYASVAHALLSRVIPELQLTELDEELISTERLLQDCPCHVSRLMRAMPILDKKVNTLCSIYPHPEATATAAAVEDDAPVEEGDGPLKKGEGV